MAYKILYTDEALADLEILIDYIRADNPAAAERFGAALLNHIELLRDFPNIGLPVRRRPQFAEFSILPSVFTTACMRTGN